MTGSPTSSAAAGDADGLGVVPPRSVLIVGASLAGLSTARALRAQGFAGRLTVLGDESHRPYDRPPLSKEFLKSAGTAAELALEAEGEELDIDWRLGAPAVGLVPLAAGGAEVLVAGGESLTADRVVLATGATPRRVLPGSDLPGVHHLRTLDDAMALRRDLAAAVGHDRPVVIVGGGFIGSEVAATARQLGAEVVMVVMEDAPLELPLGPFAEAINDLQRAHGVVIRAKALVTRIQHGDGGLEVVLASGETLPAATIVVGIGAVPAVGWLADSGLDLGPRGNGAIRCDEHGATNLPGVYAVGDCAAWHSPALDLHHHIEHWTTAKERGAIVAATLLGSPKIPASRPPYVWCDLYDKKLQLAGYRELADSRGLDAIEQGSIADGSFLAVFRRGGTPVAVLALDQARQFAGIRRRLVIPVIADNERLSAQQ